MKLDSLERHQLKVIGETTATKTWWYGKQVCTLVKTFLKKQTGHPYVKELISAPD